MSLTPERQRRRQWMAAAREGGAHSDAEWHLLVEACGCVCVKCGAREMNAGGVLTRDHIRPVSEGGSDGIENIQPLCQSCNCRKGNREWGDLRPAGWLSAFIGAPA